MGHEQDSLRTDTDVLRDYGRYCSHVGGEVHSVKYTLDTEAPIESFRWEGGRMTRLQTLQDNLDGLGETYDAVLAAQTERLARIENVLRDTDGKLRLVADNYDEADRRARDKLSRTMDEGRRTG